MLVKSQILRRSVINSAFSILKPLAVGPELKNANPFRHKSYAELTRILDSAAVQTQNIAIHNLILQAIANRIQEQPFMKKTIQAITTDAKLALISKCVTLLMERHEQLTPVDLISVVECLQIIQDSKQLSIQKAVVTKIKVQVFSLLQQMVKNDSDGKYRKQFHKLFFLTENMTKRIKLGRDIIDYLAHFSLQTNQSVIQFFQAIIHSAYIADYSANLQKILAKFIRNNAANLDNTREWVHPIIFDIFLNANLNEKKSSVRLFRKFIAALKHSHSRGQLSFSTKLEFLERNVQFSLAQSNYLSTVKQQKQDAQFSYQLFKQILNELKSPQWEGNPAQINIEIEHLIKYFRKVCVAINTSTSKIEEQVKELIEQIFKKLFETNDVSTKLLHAIIYLRKDREVSLSLQKKVIQMIMRNLSQKIDPNKIIIKIRLYEYVAYRILEGKMDLQASILHEPLLQLQKHIHRFNKFLILRIYNVMRVVKVKSKPFEDYYLHFSKNNHTEIVQNFSRTILKKQSMDLITGQLDELIKKTKGAPQKYDIEIVKSIWYSLKDYSLFEEENKNKLYEFWLHENLEFFQEVSSVIKNLVYLTKFMTKQIKNIGYFSSVRLEVLIETLRFYYLSNNQKKNKNLDDTFIQHSLKVLAKPSQTKNMVLGNYRHSFWVKLAWSNILLFESYKKKSQFFRSYMLTTQIVQILRNDSFVLMRETRDIKKLLILSMIDYIDCSQMVKMGHDIHVIEVWIWANLNNIRLNINGENPQEVQFTQQKIQKCIQGPYGPTYRVEFLVANNFEDKKIKESLQNCIFPVSLIEGKVDQFTKTDPADLLNLFSFPKTLHFLLLQNQNMPDNFIRKLCQIPATVSPQKIIQVKNYFQKVKTHLSKETIQIFGIWMQKNLQNLYRLEDDSFPLLCLQFNEQPEQGKQKVEDYIRKQLSNGNFYLASLIFSNEITGLTQEIRKLLQVTDLNRVFYFMPENQPVFLTLVNNLLGSVLHQNDPALVEDFFKIYFKYLQGFSKLLSCLHNEKQVNLLYVLLNVAKNRLPELSKSRKSIQIILQAIQNHDLNIQKKITSELNAQNAITMADYRLSHYETCQTPIPGLKLIKKNNNFVVLVHNHPGQISLMVEYLQTCQALSTCIRMQGESLVGALL